MSWSRCFFLMPRPKKSSSDSNHPKRVTLQDIAKVAGVHVMTVSDALNGRGRVARATRQKIALIAKELNYVPNATARALATGRTGRIALLSGAFDYPYYANMLHFLKLHLDEAGYKLLLLRTPNEVRELIYTTENTEADGVIAIDMYGFGEEFGEKSSIPCVSIGAYPRHSIDCVLVDLGEGVTQALDIMIDAGRHRVAYLVTSSHMMVPEESRARAYLSTLQARQRQPEIINVATNNAAQVRNKFADYIREKGCPDALLCQNDETAMSAYAVLRGLGFHVPDDVLLVGCDGQLHMEYFDPPLSTVAQPLEETCATAWRFLRQRMADPTLPHQEAVLHGELRVTRSLLASL
jgi:DNA-binding LacI/PurR family transcriptional regulator